MGYKRSRVQLILWGVPQYVLAQAPAWTGTIYDFANSLLMKGVITRMTTIQAIGQRTRTELKLCKRRVRKRDFSAVLELLDAKPWFAYHPWVQKTLQRFSDHPRFKRKRGRPRGKHHRMDPLALEGLVDCLTQSGKVKSRAAAFGLIDEWGLMAQTTAKRLYRRAVIDTTPRGVLLEFPHEEPDVSNEVAEADRARAQSVEPRTELRRAVPTQYGPAEMQIVGGELEAPTRDFFILETVSVKIVGGDNR